MTEFSAITISFVVMIGLNLLASILAVSEYRNNPVRFLKMVAIGQVMALIWHLINLQLSYSGGGIITLVLSTATILASGLYFLAASFHDRAPAVSRLAWLSLGYLLLLSVGTWMTPRALEVGWLLIFGLFGVMPLATFQFFKRRSKWLLVCLQIPVALSLVVGIPLVSSNESAEIGGFLYFLVAVFQPLVTITYVTSAIRLSRQEVAERETEYRLFFESIMEVFFRMDSQGRVLTTSPSVSQFGLSPVDIIGTELADYLTTPGEFRALLTANIGHSKALHFDGAFRTEQGKIDCHITCSAIREEHGGGLHYVGSIRNTHERNLLEQQFIDAQSRESLAVLAGGVAHDFNNILQGILGHAELLRDYDDFEEETRRQRLDSIAVAAESAGSLCRQLLLYTGRGFEHKEEFDLRNTVREVIDILKPAHRDSIRISLQIPDTPALVLGGKSQIGQIFLNLIKNALDALGPSGNITVTISPQDIAESDPKQGNPSGEPIDRPGSYYRIVVQDDGPGISKSIQQRIFDPFFTTKPDGQGLGLAAVSGILKDHKGSITLESQPNHGARFTVLLPGSQSATAPVTAPVLTRGTSGKRILLVDDDPGVLSVATTMLKRAGYSVTEAFNGEHALEMFNSADQKFDLVITDIRMPKIDGVELARSLFDSQPDLPIVLCTGYADLAERITTAESARYAILRKPYRTNELIDMVEKRLSAACTL